MRYHAYLLDRYQALVGYIGALLMTIGVIFFLPLLVILPFPEESIHAGAFLLVAIPTVISGFILWHKFTPRDSFSINLPEGMVVVVVTWIIASVIGAIPLMLTANLNFTQAAFESVSGWTTTGLSVVDVENVPKIALMYRSLLQAAGGAGFVIIAVSALAGPAGSGLSTAEGRSDQLAPHVRHSAEIVLEIYAAYIIAGVIALWLAGMDWFDALNHALTAVATGGFSTHTDSIGHYDSVAIEAIIIILMLCGALNFLTAYTLFRRKFGTFWRNGEVRLQFWLLLVAIPLVLLFTTSALYCEVGKQIRAAIFESVSALTGTGFGTVAHDEWNAFGVIVLVVLMSIGGGSGSTSGGLKQIRVYIIAKAIRWEVRRAFLPEHSVNEPSIWHGDKRGFLNDQMVRRVALYIFIYIGFLVAGTAVVAAHGYSVGDSLFEWASAMGTVGLSVGVTAPDAPATLLWAQTVGMFLGRLEFFAVLIGLTKLVRDLQIMSARDDRPSM